MNNSEKLSSYQLSAIGILCVVAGVLVYDSGIGVRSLILLAAVTSCLLAVVDWNSNRVSSRFQVALALILFVCFLTEREL